MREKLYTPLGFYLPSFFKMKVNVPDSLENLQSLPDSSLAIYLHEYIHFIQDISSTFGLMNSCITVDYLKFACQEILNSPGKYFLTPINPRPDSLNSVHVNFELRKIYQGSTSRIERISIIKIGKSFKRINFPDRTRNVPYIIVEYKDSSLSTGTFSFGAGCIKESMAYLVQSIIFPNLVHVPEVPYLSAETLITKLYPQLLKDKLNILALCDVALGTYHPGPFFYDVITKMSTENWLPNDPKDIYLYCGNQKLCSEDSINLEFLLFDTAKEAIKQVGDFFTIDIFKDNKIWIEYIIKTAVDYRKKSPSFIVDIARSGNIVNNVNFSNLFKAVGTPMVTNKNNEGTFYCPLQEKYEIGPQLFWAINQIFYILIFRQRNCELRNYCRANSISQQIPDYTDHHCDNSPWVKAKKDQLCPFGQVWKMWGLSDKEPI